MNDLGIVNRHTARQRRSAQGDGGDGQGVQAEAGTLGGADRLTGRLGLGVEVVALRQVRDQPGVGRAPSEELLRHGTGGRVVEGDQGGQEAEVVVGLLAGDADRGQVQAAADGLGDVAERDAFIGGPVQPRPGRRRLQNTAATARTPVPGA